jgi:hypothetical protein
MFRVFPAETAILGKSDPVGIVLLVLAADVVTLFAFAAREGDLYTHISFPPVNDTTILHNYSR